MIGLVSSLWRYPVKSMRGEASPHVEVTSRGIDGDRLFAVRGSDGKMGSGKHTRLFSQIDGLFAFQATYSSEWPDVIFPDGRCMRADDPRIHQALSDTLGFAVTLAREEEVSHFDRGSVHLVSTGVLGWLQSRLPGSRVDERRFRPNIVVSTDAGAPERSWVNKVIRIGDEVRLRVTEQTERCRMVTLAQDDLPEDPRALRCIAKEANARLGVYAEVITSGRISIGQAVTFECAA